MIQPIEECKVAWGNLPNQAVDDNVVYYIENNKNSKLTRYIKNHYADIRQLFHNKGLEFFYIDEMILKSTTEKQKQKAIERLFPESKLSRFDYLNLFERYIRNKQGLEAIAKNFQNSSIIVKNNNDCAYHVVINDFDDNLYYEKMFENLANIYGDKDYEIREAKEDISRLIIPRQTSEQPYIKSLKLPEYKKEICLEPAPMALYLLLLYHKDGINIADLREYKNALGNILDLTIKHDYDKEDKIVDNIINGKVLAKHISVINNEINKKIIDPKLTKYYLVNSRVVGDDKRLMIDLPREYVKGLSNLDY